MTISTKELSLDDRKEVIISQIKKLLDKLSYPLNEQQSIIKIAKGIKQDSYLELERLLTGLEDEIKKEI